MIDLHAASRIAADWHSPAEPALTALSTARKVPDRAALVQEVVTNLSNVLERPEHYDNPIQCRNELRQLLEWARAH